MGTVQIPVLGGAAMRKAHAAEEVLRRVGTSCEMELPDGQVIAIGPGPPEFRVIFRTERGLRTPLTEYALGRAYVDGDIDVTGDIMAMLDVRDKLRDSVTPGARLKFAAQLFLRAPTRVNSKAIGYHYTFGDDFYLSFIDTRYRFYSHCIFDEDGETLEEAAENKLKRMWDALELRAGMRLLDIGGGWGGVTEFCGARDVHVTSLTLVEDSANYIRNLIKLKTLPGEVFVEDILAHRPAEPYDHAVIYGVIEHIPNYRRFCEQVWSALKPGGRLYMDASATKEKYAMSAFTRRYIWHGTHTFLALQDMVHELLLHGFELVSVQRETQDYELTIRHWAERLDENHESIAAEWGEHLYRAFRLYLWGGSHAFKVNRLQAYHLVAERRADPGPRPRLPRRLGSFALSLR